MTKKGNFSINARDSNSSMSIEGEEIAPIIQSVAAIIQSVTQTTQSVSQITQSVEPSNMLHNSNGNSNDSILNIIYENSKNGNFKSKQFEFGEEVCLVE